MIEGARASGCVSHCCGSTVVFEKKEEKEWNRKRLRLPTKVRREEDQEGGK